MELIFHNIVTLLHGKLVRGKIDSNRSIKSGLCAYNQNYQKPNSINSAYYIALNWGIYANYIHLFIADVKYRHKGIYFILISSLSKWFLFGIIGFVPYCSDRPHHFIYYLLHFEE